MTSVQSIELGISTGSLGTGTELGSGVGVGIGVGVGSGGSRTSFMLGQAPCWAAKIAQAK